MPGLIVVGTQWGDEGKGKISDLLTAKADLIVRAQGGNNAGHTIVIADEEYKLHLIPSGILHPGARCSIAAGTVIDPTVLFSEVEALEARGIDVRQRLHISPGAHVIFPFHRLQDSLIEKRRGKETVGTTGRGIGPCYADKAHRTGIRIGELVRPEIFRKRLSKLMALKNEQLEKVFGAEALDFDEVYKEYSEIAKELLPMVQPVEHETHRALAANENVLFEGAQGTFLDCTCGTYPFVTSSSTVAAGVCSGAGVGPMAIDHVLGVVKAYTTRVGAGPLPSEMGDDENFLEHKQDRETGTTTGRKRRAGWFDAVLVAEAVRLNSINLLALTKLDVLDRLEELKICVGYELDGERHDYLPAVAYDFERLQPIYETLPGWLSDTRSATSLNELPTNARNYINRIEELLQVPIGMISVGPGRDETIILCDPFAAKEPAR